MNIVSRRSFLKTCTAAVGTIPLAFSRCDSSRVSKPNIVIIYADDLGYGDLSCFGGDIPTPHIDSIADAGMRFTDFYVAAPVCTPSRYGLFTGCYPNRSMHGLQRVIMPGHESHLDPCEKILPQYLKEAGYRTGLFGKWHLGSRDAADLPMNHGFDRFSGHTAGCIDYFEHTYGALGSRWYVDGAMKREQGYSTDLITNHALSFLKEAGDREQPIFTFLSYNAPHYGKSDPEKLPPNTVVMRTGTWMHAGIANTLQVPEAYLRRFEHIEDVYRRTYAAMVSCMDDNVGRMIEALKETGVYENTMIWFLSDNGGYSRTYFGHADNGALRGEKASLREGGIRIPAMVCWPERVRPGQVCRRPLCNVDLLPTLAYNLGFRKSLGGRPVDGANIGPVILGNKKIDRDLYWKFGRHTALRNGRWKLFDGEELYDLEEDLGERNNVADAYPDLVRRLKEKLRYYEENVTTYRCPEGIESRGRG